jgi:NADH-quinone oxidoreductase subunit G
MCDEGRFGFKYVHNPDRLVLPIAKSTSGRLSNDWSAVLLEVQSALRATAAANPGKLAAVLSPWMTCEEAFLLGKQMKSLSTKVRLAMGPVRIVGDPKRVDDQPAEETKFTIRAEKCPNRAGVAEILTHFEGKVLSFDDLKAMIAAGQVDSLYAVGGDREPWVTDADRGWLSKLKLLIVQDILPSPASDLAQYVLPAGSFVEKDGTFINHAGLAQAVQRAVRCPGEARPDLRILWDLAGRRGMFHAATVRAEIGSEIEALAALRSPSLGAAGRLLSEGPASESHAEWGAPGREAVSRA